MYACLVGVYLWAYEFTYDLKGHKGITQGLPKELVRNFLGDI